MGTSQSSNGSPPGVPMVPPWTPPPPPDDNSALPPGGDDGAPPDDAGNESAPPDHPAPPPKPLQPPIAPAGRFTAARSGVGNFANTGDKAALRRGLGHYVRKGYGGSKTAAARMGGTSATAAGLYNALAPGNASATTITGEVFDRTVLVGRTAKEVINAVIEAVRPIEGTQDAEAARASLRDALSEVLVVYPDADLLDLNAEQREFAVEMYVAEDIYRRFDLDLGTHIRSKAPSATSASSRMKQARDYIKERVRASFRKLRKAGQVFSDKRVHQIVHQALRDTFQVFEGYAE